MKSIRRGFTRSDLNCSFIDVRGFTRADLNFSFIIMRGFTRRDYGLIVERGFTRASCIHDRQESHQTTATRAEWWRRLHAARRSYWQWRG
jgi:hypothetical protein